MSFVSWTRKSLPWLLLVVTVSVPRLLLPLLLITWTDAQELSTLTEDLLIILTMKLTKNLRATFKPWPLCQMDSSRWARPLSSLMIELLVKSGHPSSDKTSNPRVEKLTGNLMLPILQPTWIRDNLMLQLGAQVMVCGPDRPLPSSLITPVGFIFLPTLFSSTTLFQDLKVNSQDISTHGLKIGKAQIIIGFIKDLTMNLLGCFLSKCGDGSSGTTVPMFWMLINPRLDGITFQIVITLAVVSPTLNTFIIIISIPTFMKNLEKQEELKAPTELGSMINTITSQDGEPLRNIERHILKSKSI